MAEKKNSRFTVYNNITSKEKLKDVNEKNRQLEEDYLEYLASIDLSPNSIKQYKSNLRVFWCWNLDFNGNKFFVDLTKREVAKFQNHALNVWGWSSKRIRTVKATLSSLSNYIETILDDEFPNFRPIINKIKSPADEPVREKTILEEDELDKLLDYLVLKKKYEMACILSLAMNSGRRKDELTRFKVSYFEDENLICDGALYKTPEKMKTKGRGKTGKMLEVYTLAKQFKPYLDLWLLQRKREGANSEWLFPKYDHKNHAWLDEPITISQMNSWAKIFSRMLGKNFYWHACRHWWTSHTLDKGLPESVVQTLQGWSTGDMVGIYDDRSKEAQFDKYFDKDGIKQVERASLKDLGDAQ